MGSFREFSGSAVVAVATTDEFAQIILTENSMAIELANAGANALDALEIWVKAHSAGAFIKMHSAAADYTTPKGLVKAASVDPTTLASGASASIKLTELEAYFAISLRASSAVGTTTLNWKARVDG